jgi:hypothetical protein
MRTVLVGVFYKGEPVYRQWDEGKTEVSFFSRETKNCVSGGWKFVRWIPLKTIKLSTKWDHVERMRKIYEAQSKLMDVEGVTESARM